MSNIYQKKGKRIFASVIAILLVLAMIVPLAISAFV